MEYSHLLDFIRHKQRSGTSKRYMNYLLNIFRHYFDFLTEKGEIKTNIASGLIIRGVQRGLTGNLLTKEELDRLFETFPDVTLTDKRNKAMLGLLIYQGLTNGELEALQPEHLSLKKGTIYIPGSLKSNSRLLKLESFQVCDLMNYQSDIRPKLLAMSGKVSGRLFVSKGTGQRLQNTLKKLIKRLQKENPKVKDITLIRNSVITTWLKTNNLRQVQYWAGHRYVSSTERYQTSDLEQLSKNLEKYHPLEDLKQGKST
jgi:integrase/recombinase XerD